MTDSFAYLSIRAFVFLIALGIFLILMHYKKYVMFVVSTFPDFVCSFIPDTMQQRPSSTSVVSSVVWSDIKSDPWQGFDTHPYFLLLFSH